MRRRETKMLILANDKQWNAAKTLKDEHNLDINYQSLNGGLRLLHLAAMQGNMKAVIWLLNSAANKEAKTSTGADAAHIAHSFAYFDLEYMINSFAPEEAALAGEAE